MRRVLFLAFPLVLAFAVSGCTGGPAGSMSAPPSSVPSSAAPLSTVDALAAGLAALAASSYRFTIEYAVPGPDIDGFELPDQGGEGDGVADPLTGVLRVETASASGVGELEEVLVIGTEAWTRLSVDGEPLRGWSPSVGSLAFHGLHPWRIPVALADATDVKGGPGEYTGTFDLPGGEDGLASTVVVLGGEVEADAAAFTVTLGPDGRPTAFRFTTADGALSASYTFTDYGVAVDEKPPPADEIAEPAPWDPGDSKGKCLVDGEIVDCPDFGGPAG